MPFGRYIRVKVLAFCMAVAVWAMPVCCWQCALLYASPCSGPALTVRCAVRAWHDADVAAAKTQMPMPVYFI